MAAGSPDFGLQRLHRLDAGKVRILTGRFPSNEKGSQGRSDVAKNGRYPLLHNFT
jgi:hypothetical protein